MMKITGTDQRREEKTKIKSRKGHHGLLRSESAFETELKTSIEYTVEGNLNQLIEELQDQEKRFLEEQSIYEMARYKKIVQKILKMLIDDGFETRTLRRNRRDRADYTIVEQINARLREITAAITTSNKAFNLLKTVEEIRGLILDLSM